MDREAVTAPVAMSIAMALFLGFFATIALTSNSVGGEGAAEASDSARLRVQADSLLDLMLQSPGYTNAGQDWIGLAEGDDREDDLRRLGLREAGGNSLDFDKFQNLRLAPYTAAADGYVNYEEARSALGFDQTGLGFHVRAKPSLKSVQDVLANGERDPNMKVTYIAATDDSGEAAHIDITNLQCTVVGGHLQASLDVAIQSEGQPAKLSAFITLVSPETETTTSTSRSEWVNGPVVQDDGVPVTLTSAFPFYDDGDATTTELCSAGTQLTATLWDSTQSLKSRTVTVAGVSGHTSRPHGLLLDTSKTYVLSGEDAEFAYGGDNLDKGVALTFTLEKPDGSAPSFALTADNVNKRTITVGDSPSGFHPFEVGTLVAGTYTASLTDGTSTVTETLHVFAAPPPDYDEPGLGSGNVISPGGEAEVTNLHNLVERFCPFHHDTSAGIVAGETFTDRCQDWIPNGHLGDVILDSKKNMDDGLPARLLDAAGAPTYDWVTTLVVGSNVNHQSMTSASAKHAVRDWVLGGGTLIVFGSSEQAVQWLQPIFHSGIQSSSGGIGTPDADHPLLQVSDTLAYDSYSNQGRTWDLKSSGAQSSSDKFTDVVEDGDGQAILTISDPGAYGEGTIILTTWMPYDIFGDGSDPGTEGPKLVNNLLMQSYRGLFLDYGPPLPEGQAVVPATGKAQVYHPELDRLVSLDVTLFVFRQG